jgi:hypothetical protein
MNFMRFIWIFFALWIAACTPLIPATTPPQLEHTPGAFVTVDDDRFDTGIFRVDYPDGWRIVKTSVASAPLEVVFASPDNSMTIQIVEGNAPFPESTPDPAIYERWEWIDVSSITVTVIGKAPIETKGEFDLILDRVITSITTDPE